MHPSNMIPVSLLSGRSHFQWGIQWQQEFVSRQYQRVITYLDVRGSFLGVLENFVLLYSRHVGDVPGRSGNGDVSREVKTDVPASKRHAVVTHCLIPPVGTEGRPSRSGVPVLERSRDPLEQAFDEGLVIFRRCILLVLPHWFYVSMIACFRPIQCWCWQYCLSRNWIPACYALQGSVYGWKSTNSGFPDENFLSSFFYSRGCSVPEFLCLFCVYRTWWRSGQTARPVKKHRTPVETKSVNRPRKISLFKKDL